MNLNVEKFIKGIDEAIEFHQKNQNDPHNVGNAVIVALSDIKRAMGCAGYTPPPILEKLGDYIYLPEGTKIEPGDECFQYGARPAGWRRAEAIGIEVPSLSRGSFPTVYRRKNVAH